MFNFNMFAEQPRPFNTMYKCYSVSMLPGTERNNVDRGGRIFLPPSALDQLTRLNIIYPMLFKLTNPSTGRVTHCGVLEFTADEGKCYMPYWMLRNLLLDEGAVVKIESASLPLATFSKFQPQSVDFLEITNPKAVLENELRNFACLTTGDVIAIMYNDRVYELCVLKTQPEAAVNINECDMNVDFAPPVGYVEPKNEIKKEKTPPPPVPKSRGFRIDGKSTDRDDEDAPPLMTNQAVQVERGQPDYDYKPGFIKFFRNQVHDATREDCRAHLRQQIEQVENYIGGELSRIEEQVDIIEKESPRSRCSFKSLKSDLQIMRSYIKNASDT